ncbi:MAG: DUF368 domain-containing protein [Balneolaceae bacterium]
MSEANRPNTSSNQDQTTWRETPFLIIKGFLMGSADIVPGVSGGTMALITGIYDRLIHAIKSVDSRTISSFFRFRFKTVLNHLHWKFLLLLFTGIFLAIIFFTKIVPLQVYMFSHPEIVYGLFFGLIVGSIFLLIAEISPSDRSWKNLLPLIAGALFGFWVVTLVPADTPETFWYVFLSGSVAICAMILPGISGSYLLLIFQKYDYILTQLGSIGSSETIPALLNLLPFISGAIVGLALFSRLLSWLLNNYHAITLLVLIGFLIGSLYVIWPYQEREFQESVRSVEILPVTDPLVQNLMNREEIPKTPGYKRIGRELPAAEEPGSTPLVEVETVSRKLISSEPFMPGVNTQQGREEVNLAGGLAGMAVGLIMISGISFLRRKS